MFDLSSSLHPLLGEGSGLLSESVGKATLLSDHFDGKQSRESVNLLLTCHPSPSLITVAIRSREIMRLLLVLDPCGGTDPLGMFLFFVRQMLMFLVKCFGVFFVWVVFRLPEDRKM